MALLTGDFDFLATAQKEAYKQKEAYRVKHPAEAVAFTGVRCQFGGVGEMSDVRLPPPSNRYPKVIFPVAQSSTID